jgi:hypothetical protein
MTPGTKSGAVPKKTNTVPKTTKTVPKTTKSKCRKKVPKQVATGHFGKNKYCFNFLNLL